MNARLFPTFSARGTGGLRGRGLTHQAVVRGTMEDGNASKCDTNFSRLQPRNMSSSEEKRDENGGKREEAERGAEKVPRRQVRW